MSNEKHNVGVMTFRVTVHNFNSNIDLDKLTALLHDHLDAATLETIKAHTKDEKWQYELEAYVKPEGENKQNKSGHNFKTKESAENLQTIPKYQIGSPERRIKRFLREVDHPTGLVKIMTQTRLSFAETVKTLTSLIESNEVSQSSNIEGTPVFILKKEQE